jgi:3',5'-cyclic AMP phosphodiesterase CpdA
MQRRPVLKQLGALALMPSLAFGKFAGRRSQPVLRIAHITDVHLKNDLDAPAKFTRCLHHIQHQSPKVDMILNGGDIVFDMNKENITAIDAQWQLWHSIIKNECSIPIHYCIGNHDIWWLENSRQDVFYGKEYALNQLQMPLPYYSFNNGNWKFIVLDSVHLDIDGTWYIGKLGDAQFAWLKQQLDSTSANMPVCILSHIPILTATLMVEDDIVNKWEFLGGDMHTDVAKIINLFNNYPQVKLCLSGHIHLRDKVTYNNKTYICNGAVSGAWWQGNKRETVPGYGLLDLYADGSFTEQYVPYL